MIVAATAVVAVDGEVPAEVVDVEELDIVVGDEDNAIEDVPELRSNTHCRLTQEYPWGQHAVPQVERVTLRSLECTVALGYRLSSCRVMSHAIGCMRAQSCPSGQQSTVFGAAMGSMQDVPDRQQNGRVEQGRRLRLPPVAQVASRRSSLLKGWNVAVVEARKASEWKRSVPVCDAVRIVWMRT